LGVRIVMENMPGLGVSHFTGPGDLELGELGLVLDCGHAAISGTLDEFLADPQAALTHVHLHSNAGPADSVDSHGPLGEGVVDALAVLRVARTAGATVILEHLDEAAAVASIAYLEAHGIA
jgi:sugar phosphate isomerase/epimerase